MTGNQKVSSNFESLTRICIELKECLRKDDQELPKGRFEQLKEIAAEAAGLSDADPELQTKLAEFETLCKKYMNRIHELYKSRDLARWEHYTLKMDLCKQVKNLKECNDCDLPRVARELKSIRLQWKNTGSVPHDKSEELWDEFSEEYDKLQKRITEYYNVLDTKREAIAQDKIKICEEAENIQSLTDWTGVAQQFKKLQKRWREVGFTVPVREKELYIRFRAACNVFFNARKTYYQKVKFDRESVTAVKFRLCEEAKTIFSLSYSEAHQLIPDLWKRWKAAGSAGKNDRELYEKFRGCFDDYYEGLRKQRSENLKTKKNLCQELEKLQESLDEGVKRPEAAETKYLDIKKRWDAVGAMPRAEEKPILNKYFALCKGFEKLKTEPDYHHKNVLKRSFELERIVSAALDSLDSRKLEAWEKCQAEWEAAGSAEKKYFKHSFEAIGAAFESGPEHCEQLLRGSEDNLKRRQEICVELESLGIKPEDDATDNDLAEELTQAIAKNFAGNTDTDTADKKAEKINEIARRWLEAGTVP
ncbi:MAG: DUF349 domain-containing protein, partial [Victivallaceae bacterium]|nr:DUF349 domain-containing protein [Victivallaceae bacterium]